LQRYGDLDLRTNHLLQAREKYARARDIYQQLVQEDPEVTEYQDDLARANYDLGNVALREKNPKDAERCFQLSLKMRKQRADADPDDLSAKKNYMTTFARCGDHVAATCIAGEILKVMEDGDSLIEAANCYAVSVGAVEGGRSEHQLLEKDRNARRAYLLGCIEALHKAVAKGYRNIVNLETEPDLDSVRQKPEFQAFLAELRKTLTLKGASGT
jgi:tetratricopeptide (TPR) repeat protein